MGKHLKFISSEYLDTYAKKSDTEWMDVFHELRSKSNFTQEDFDYYIVASSLYSSKIEGNSIDFNSFYRNRKAKGQKTKEIREIEDLAKAYVFASSAMLNRPNFLKAHGIPSKTVITKADERGKVRTVNVGVFDKYGRPAYMAADYTEVKTELNKLFYDIDILLKRNLSYKEVFYYASMIHLWTAIIHPFTDGNGRAARLLEKWFLVNKLGAAAWSINSEKYYWDNRPAYYNNIALGYNYYSLYWERCIPFLLMLPKALKG